MSVNRGLWVLVLSVLAVRAQAYNYQYSLPGAPTRPGSEAQCNAIQDQYRKVFQQLEETRSKCVDNMGSRYEPGGSKWDRAIEVECKPIAQERTKVNDEGISVYHQCLANLKMAQDELREQQREREALLRQQQQSKIQKYEVVDRKGQDVFIKPVQRPTETNNAPASQPSGGSSEGNSMQGDINYRQVQRALDIQRRAAVQDQAKLAMLQAGTGMLSTLSKSLLNEAMTSRNDHYDAAVSTSNARVREMADLVGGARGESGIITSIQKNSLREIGRQHNMILGDLEKVRRDIEGLKVEQSSGSSSSDSGFRPTPAARVYTSDDSDTDRPDSARHPQPETAPAHAGYDSPEQEQAVHQSQARTEELRRIVHESEVEHSRGTVHEYSRPTRIHEDNESSEGHHSGGELARPSDSDGNAPDRDNTVLAAGNARPEDACNFFNHEADPRQHWHTAGTLVCRKEDMYRCQDSSWLFAGKCSKYPNWQSRTVDKLESFIQ